MPLDDPHGRSSTRPAPPWTRSTGPSAPGIDPHARPAPGLGAARHRRRARALRGELCRGLRRRGGRASSPRPPSSSGSVRGGSRCSSARSRGCAGRARSPCSTRSAATSARRWAAYAAAYLSEQHRLVPTPSPSARTSATSRCVPQLDLAAATGRGRLRPHPDVQPRGRVVQHAVDDGRTRRRLVVEGVAGDNATPVPRAAWAASGWSSARPSGRRPRPRPRPRRIGRAAARPGPRRPGRYPRRHCADLRSRPAAGPRDEQPRGARRGPRHLARAGRPGCRRLTPGPRAGPHPPPDGAKAALARYSRGVQPDVEKPASAPRPRTLSWPSPR